jgi:hypothetical protein
VYRPGELTELATSLNGLGSPPWVGVEAEYYDTGNWCLVVRKLAEAPREAWA